MNRVAQGTLVGLLGLAAAALGGCGSTEVDFTAGGVGGSSSTGSSKTGTSSANTGGMTGTSSANTGGMTTTSSTTGTSMAGTGGASTTTTTTVSTTTTGPGPTSSSTGGGCSADSADSACVACTKQSCCSTLVPCQSDASCVCWSGCLEQNPNNPQACFSCGNPDQTTNAFIGCASQSCAAACEGGTTTTTGTSSGGTTCPPAAGDTACLSCAKMSCCSQVNACEADQSCLCLLGCLTQGGSYDQCTKPAPTGCGPAPVSFLTLAACTGGPTSPCKTACQ